MILGGCQTTDHQSDTAAEKSAVEALSSLEQPNAKLDYSSLPKEYRTTIKWLTMAANEGLASAQYNLGLMYLNGSGVSQDDKTAFKWIQKAAIQRHVNAEYHLAVLYAKGQGVTRDREVAIEWLKIAAEDGDERAIFYLRRWEKIVLPKNV